MPPVEPSQSAPLAPVPCVVLAGGKAKPDLIAATGQTNRALIVVNGKTLLRHVVDGVRAADATGPVTVVGDVPEAPDYACIPDQGDFVGNVFAGLNAYTQAPFLLISTSDLPFLSGDSVDDFVRGARELAERSGASLIWPIVPVATCYQRFPGVKRTALKLREGEFTGGNLALVRPDFLLANRQRIADSYAARKSPLKMAALLGMGTLLRVAFSQKFAPRLLTLTILEERVSHVMGGPCRAYPSPYPEIATDLDRPSDFEAVGLAAGV